QYLKNTVKSINSQILENKTKFFLAFFNHYISKNTIKEFVFFKFPSTKFKYSKVVLKTRPNTIDFWVCLESYEPDLTYFLTDVVNEKKGTFIDVGGHIGRYSTLMAKQNWNVFAFEPIKNNYDILCENLNYNNCSKNAIVYNLGLGNENIEKTIYFNEKEMGEASLIQQDEQNQQTKIKIVKFDDFMKLKNFEKFIIVKIDVEGFENEVLTGMKNFLKTYKPIIVLELWKDNSDKISTLLKEIGYQRLHIFWFIKETHQSLIDPMYLLYSKNKMGYEYV